MGIRIFLQQLRRGKRRTLLNILLLAAVTAFFVMSVNLYKNSAQNLERVNETYTTIAVMELHGDIDTHGNPVTDLGGDYAGYLPALVYGYDLTPVTSSPYVIQRDLRYRYTAYVPGHAIYSHNLSPFPGSNLDLIRFVIEGEEPLAVEIGSGKINYSEPRKARILESAAGIYDYPSELCFWLSLKPAYQETYREDILALNQPAVEEDTETLWLYPGVEYIASVIPYTTDRIAENGHFVTDGRLRINYDSYGEDYVIQYTSSGEVAYRGVAEGQPFWIHRWDEVQRDPELRTYYEGAMNAAKYTAQTLPVTLTDDVGGIAPFHLGAAYLIEGRMITEEEYEVGAKVCMIGSRLAENQGWKVGDVIEMELYDGSVFPNVYTDAYINPTYNKTTTGVFDEGSYEIVGVYGQRELAGNSGISAETLAQPWNNIYIPKNAVQNRPDAGREPVHGVLLTLWLENGSVDAFLNEMAEKGVTQAKSGGFEARFTVYDQGYSQVQPSLQAMLSTSRLLLILSAILLAVTVLLVAYFFAQNMKPSVGVFRMLGGRKGQALAAVLCGAFLIAAFSGAAGMAAGGMIAERMGEKLLTEGLAQTQEDTLYAAYSTGVDTLPEIELATGARPELVIFAGTAAIGLFLLLLAMFLAAYIGKEPQALLPRQKG